MPNALPPLVFAPRFVEKIWGGRRLETSLNKRLPDPKANFGESWEIYDFPPGVVDGSKEWLSSVVATGPLKGTSLHTLVTEQGEALLGEKKPWASAGGPQFPLLIKFLDAKDDLSIQVHPTPEYAAKHQEAHLKTECWIVLDHSPGAFLYKGLKEPTTREKFEKAIQENHCQDLIEQVPAKKGDCHFLPSSTVHALGAGTLIAEVQTPSDTTFRVYDFGRLENGKPRKLHVMEALECIDFSAPKPPAVTSTNAPAIPLVDCEYFKTTTLKYSAHKTVGLGKGTMKIWMVTEGAIKLAWQGGTLQVRAGQTLLLPALLMTNCTATFTGNTTVLETVLP